MSCFARQLVVLLVKHRYALAQQWPRNWSTKRILRRRPHLQEECLTSYKQIIDLLSASVGQASGEPPLRLAAALSDDRGHDDGDRSGAHFGAGGHHWSPRARSCPVAGRAVFAIRAAHFGVRPRNYDLLISQ